MVGNRIADNLPKGKATKKWADFEVYINVDCYLATQTSCYKGIPTCTLVYIEPSSLLHQALCTVSLTDGQTDRRTDRQTELLTTVTLAAHAREG